MIMPKRCTLCGTTQKEAMRICILIECPPNKWYNTRPDVVARVAEHKRTQPASRGKAKK